MRAKQSKREESLHRSLTGSGLAAGRVGSRRPYRWLGAGLICSLLAVGGCQSTPVFDVLPPTPLDTGSYVTNDPELGRFRLSVNGQSAPWVISSDDYVGVRRAVEDVQQDVGKVTGFPPDVSADELPDASEVVLVGTLGKSPLIDRLVRAKKLHVDDVRGRWETSLIQVVENPFPGVRRALVLAGSDKRGTIYALYDLAERIGVSPWYYFADVPVERQTRLYIKPGRYSQGEPAVKYRGIFINNEHPALSTWVTATFGPAPNLSYGFNHQFYEKVFELILRLKGNYLWPAMWGRSFYDDDPMNGPLADEYGIVMGTSHHEPMTRAHAEWPRHGEGPWDFDANKDVLTEFWRGGMERLGDQEAIVSIGMRGDGDEALTDEANIELLERIVAAQRDIIDEVTGRGPDAVPQVWTLYKEVQDYHDRGMDVPDDVTLMFANDNWGNIRKLPKPEDTRPGGYGMYYHFDYVGGPRSYKWLNTVNISRVWEQMHLAHQNGADTIWIVNVGDIKPMEFPTTFFLDYAWDPDRWGPASTLEYTEQWAAKYFGSEHASTIAHIINTYTKFNARRKPELLDPTTYSLENYREAERVVDEYNELLAQAEELYQVLPVSYRDAYYQLALHPVEACANLNELYATVAKNRLYAEQGRAATNAMAERARELFERDAAITDRYHGIADGKWNHMMSQTHIGYTNWQDPPENIMPNVSEIDVPEAAELGVAIEGSRQAWPGSEGEPVLPEFSPYQAHEAQYIEVFNRGRQAFDFEVEVAEPWVSLSQSSGQIEQQERLWVSIDWEQAPHGVHTVPITIKGPGGSEVVVQATVNHPEVNEPVTGFIEANGYVSMEAPNFTEAVSADPIHWQTLPDLSRTEAGVTTFPVTAASLEAPGEDTPRLEYAMHLFSTGEVTVRVHLAPTLPFHSKPMRYAVSIDDAPPQIVNIHPDLSESTWEAWVASNVNITSTQHSIEESGPHVLKFWMMDSGVVLQKLIVETSAPKQSYLGPPQSVYVAP